MRFSHASRTRLIGLSLGLGAAGIGLAGCGSIDDALFGNQPPAAPPAAETTQPPEGATAETGAGEAAPVVAPAPATGAAELGIALPAIEPGTDTGTPVGQTVQRLRGEISALHDKAAADLQQYGTLRTAVAQNVTTYQEAKSHIIIRLQVGTTKGNPQLVNTWNTGQSALDTLTGNINSFAALGTEAATDAGRAHTERDTISDTFNMAGGVDEDHRQLTALQQEASQLASALDRLNTDIARDVQRQTAFVASERSSLATLENDIKNGELYATSGTMATPTASPIPAAGSSEMAKAIVTIRFDRAKVEFEQDLYAALNQALQAKPGASFSVVAVSPTRGSAAALRKVQSQAQRHAQEVLKSMTDMGVPAARVTIASSTDPGVSSSEVRVYAK